MKSIIFCLIFIQLIAIKSVITAPTFDNLGAVLGGIGRLGGGLGGIPGFSGGLGGLGVGPGLFRPGFAHNGFAHPGFGSQGLGFGPGWQTQSWGMGWPSGHGIRNGILG